MDKRLKLGIGLIFISIIALVALKLLSQETQKSPSIIKDDKNITRTSSINKTKKIDGTDDSVKPKQKLPKEKSFHQIIKKFSQVKLRQMKTKKFTSLLEELKLIPQMVRSRSGKGRMTVIRTENNLPGTRYIHAQFFGENNKEFIQHLSLEYKKGDNAFEEVSSMVKENYPIIASSEYRNQKFVQWDLDEDYHIWIKELNREDMQNDPFNAYDLKNDVGNIRVTIEMKIH